MQVTTCLGILSGRPSMRSAWHGSSTSHDRNRQLTNLEWLWGLKRSERIGKHKDSRGRQGWFGMFMSFCLYSMVIWFWFLLERDRVRGLEDLISTRYSWCQTNLSWIRFITLAICLPLVVCLLRWTRPPSSHSTLPTDGLGYGWSFLVTHFWCPNGVQKYGESRNCRGVKVTSITQILLWF